MTTNFRANFFATESHYFSAVTLLVCIYTLSMHFFFPREWADSTVALQLISFTARVVPAVRRLFNTPGEYSDYRGVFFSLFWLTTPVYWIMGFLGGSKLGAYRYQKVFIEATLFRIVCCFLMASLGAVFMLLFPVYHGILFIRQTNQFAPLLAYSWWITAGVFYVHAQVLYVLVKRIAH